MKNTKNLRQLLGLPEKKRQTLNFKKVAAKMQRIVKAKGLTPDIVEEAIQWARQQKMKKLYEFPVLWSGWELDEKGWVALDNSGQKVIILTNHGAEYVASIDDLQKHLLRYKEATEATEKAIKMVLKQ